MVSVPQDLVSLIVSKAVKMSRKMIINILSVIENMSYITCPDCGKKISLFNGENTEKFLRNGFEVSWGTSNVKQYNQFGTMRI